MPTRRLSPDRLLAEMGKRGVTRRELARRVADKTGQDAENTVRPALSRHLNHKTNATVEIIERYADALGVSSDAITVEPDPEADAEIAKEKRRHNRRLAAMRERQTARWLAEGQDAA